MGEERCFCGSEDELQGVGEKLKLMPCPYCKVVGMLILHGFLRGYDEQNPRQQAVRARRVFCSRRGRRKGCGRTFSVWLADKVRRLSLTAGGLWTFLKKVAGGGDKLHAMRGVTCHLKDSAPYRIWNRFAQAQSKIRTALAKLVPPPDVAAEQPGAQTVAHLEAAFPDAPCPIVAFQRTLRMFFM